MMNDGKQYECTLCGKRISGEFYHWVFSNFGLPPRCTCSPNYLDGSPMPGVWELVSEVSELGWE